MGLLDQWNQNEKPDNTRAMIQKAIDEGLTVKIKYRKYEGEFSERKLSNLAYNNNYAADGFVDDHVKGYCHLRKEERTFKIARIVSVEIVKD